ncbi:MAG: DUF3108 domain-containing protein [Alphaproteobacteria bacterium]|nr:DUF3108 domain-containing protein [Alphaproteobacteria bacterium]
MLVLGNIGRLARLAGSAGVFLALVGLAPVSAQQFFAEARYSISLRGIGVAKLKVGFTEDGQGYRVAIDANVSGLAQLVASGTANVSSSGRSLKGGLLSESFSLRTQTDAGTFKTTYEANNGNVSSFLVTPTLAPNPDRVPVRAPHRKNINDPVAVFLLKDELGANACKQSFRVFTGVERFDLALSFAEIQKATSKRTGYQGPVIMCNMRYSPISGHFRSAETTRFLAANQGLLMWFAPLGDTGFLLPYRMLIGTSFGDLSMVLTKLDISQVTDPA